MTKEIQQRLRLHALNFAQPFRLFWRPSDCGLRTRIHESAGIPFTAGQKFHGQLRCPARWQQLADAPGDFWKCRMRPHATPPILRVKIIRLAPVHEGVNKTAVGVLNALREGVRGIEMIVPEQNQRPDERLLPGWKFGFAEQ